MRNSRLYQSSVRIRSKRVAAHVVAVALALAALSIRLALGSAFVGFPFITFTPAVVIAGYLGGVRGGLTCTALCAGSGWYFLLDPPNSFALHRVHDAVALAMFVLNSTLIVWVIAGMHAAYRRLLVVETNHESLNAELEARVATRTRELSAANEAMVAEGRARQEAEARAAQMERLDAVGRLTGGVAHDFNNMLAVIIGNLELTLAKLNRGDTDVLRHIDGAMDGARRSATLTRRLLAFARRQPLEPVVTNVNDLIKGIEELLVRTLGERISIECELASDLWHTCVDPGQLEGALVNLAVNARDAMPEGGQLFIRTRNVVTAALREAPADLGSGDYVLIEVADSGVGMSDEVQSRAFEPFYTTKEPGRGTGLGLSQLYGFMQQSEGGVSIRSRGGSGTSIFLYLPRCSALAEHASREADSEEAAPRGTGDRTILVVEDEERVRSSTVETLRELGYRVIGTGAGQQALALFTSGAAIDLVLSDIVMPGMNGPELVARVKKFAPDIPVLFMSGYSPELFGTRPALQDDVELLTKPFTRDQLARRVAHLLRASGMAQ